MGAIFSSVTDYLQAQDLELSIDGDDMASFAVEAGHTPWRLHLWANEDAQQLLIHSVSPFVVPEQCISEMALFLTRANFGLAIGNFELDLDNGELRYKTSIDANGQELSTEWLRPLFLANISTMDRYLPGILAVTGGVDAATAILAVES
jgi:hypothetical protein